jgi:hypothetical protein
LAEIETDIDLVAYESSSDAGAGTTAKLRFDGRT